MKRRGIALVSGLVFGIGLVVAGMTDPTKVRGFLDVTGAWDPSLALVMVSAIGVASLGFAWAARRSRTWLGEPMELPSTRKPIDAGLLAGATLFGIGWGLAGICPGPAIVSIGALRGPAVVFTIAMLAGIAIVRALRALRAAPPVERAQRT